MRLEASVGDNMKLNVTQWLIVLMCVLALAGGATAQVSVNAVGADVGVAVGVEAPAGGGSVQPPAANASVQAPLAEQWLGQTGGPAGTASMESQTMPAADSIPSLVALGAVHEPMQLGLHIGTPERFRWHVSTAAASGAAMVPLEFRWDKVELQPGRFDWGAYDQAVDAAKRRGLRLVGVLHYPAHLPPLTRSSRIGWPSAHVDDWDYFVRRVVVRYVDDIHDWIVVRGRTGSRDPVLAAAEADLDARLAQLTADAIRIVDPRARVLSAAPGADLRWLTVFAASGGLTAVDGLALDINRWPAGPEGLEGVIADVETFVNQMGFSPTLWVWRFGYPTHEGISTTAPRRFGVTLEEQAAYVVRAHAMLAAADVDAVLWQELVNSGRDRADAAANFGLYESLGRGKPASYAYATMTDMLAGLGYVDDKEVVADWAEHVKWVVEEAIARAKAAAAYEAVDVAVPDDIFGDDVAAAHVVPDASTADNAVPLGSTGADAGAADGGAPGNVTVGIVAVNVVAFDVDTEEVAPVDTRDQTPSDPAETESGIEPTGELVGEGAGEAADAAEFGLDEDDADVIAVGRIPEPMRLEAETLVAAAAEGGVYIHAHLFAGEERAVVVVWSSAQPSDGAALLTILDGMPVRLYDLFGKRIDTLVLPNTPMYIELLTDLHSLGL